MKVLFLRSGYGKPDSRLEKEIIVLADSNYEVNICAWNRDSNKDEDHELCISNHEIKYHHIGIESVLAAGFKKNIVPMMKFNMKLYQYLRRYGSEYDVVHASDFDTVLPAYLLRKKKYKLIYDIYDYYADSHHMPDFIDNLIRRIDTKIINNCDATIICNEKRKEQLASATPKRLYVIHNSPENVDVKPDYSHFPKGKKLRVVFIGAFSATGRYIREMVEVIKSRHDVELIVGGYGYKPIEDYLEAIAAEYESIVYIGKQEYKKVLEIEATADVITALYDPSLKNHQYAAPNKFYEGLMLGKPIICAKNTCIDDIIRNHGIGWVLNVPECSFEDEFNKALDDAIVKIDRLSGYGEIMKKLYLDKYNWNVMKERLRELYESL